MKIFTVNALGTKLHGGISYITFNSIDDLVKDQDRCDQEIFLIQDLPKNFEKQLQHAKQRVAQQEQQKKLAMEQQS